MKYVVCDFCKTKVYVAKKELVLGDVLNTDDFEGVGKFDKPKKNDFFCPKCDMNILRSFERAYGVEVPKINGN